MIKGILGLVLGIGVLAYGIWFFFDENTRQKRFAEAESWPETVGTIVSSELHEFEATKAISAHLMLRLSYEYQVNGVTYSSDRFNYRSNPTFGLSERYQAEQMLYSQYPTGQQVRVFYNPESPEDALLNPASVQEEIGDWTVLVGGPAMIGFVGVILVVMSAVGISESNVGKQAPASLAKLKG